MSLLGIDVGTTGCKAAAFAADGRSLASAYREYPILFPGDRWAELDSRQVLEGVRAVIAEVAGRVARADPVTALSLSSMGEAMTPVGRNGEILGHSILSSDIRGGEYIGALKRRIEQHAFYAINPNILGPNYSLPKLLWIKEHQADLYARTHKFLLWCDLVACMLTGEAVTGYSLANRTLLFDIRAQDWSDKLLVLSGIERDKLPRCLPAGAVIGTVGRKIAAELNLAPGVAVVVGGHDQCCNSLGAGITAVGKAVCGIGSYECVTPTYGLIPAAEPMLKQGLNVEHHVLPGLYVSFIYNQGGLLVKWFRDTFARGDMQRAGTKDVYAQLDAEMPAEPTRLLSLPYFDITGPPQFVTDASGVIAGLKTSTSRGEILKSILESVTFYFVDSVWALRDLGIDTNEFIATGGGAKSDPWLQIKADIFGVPFVRPRVTEGSLLGAAILAGLATGLFKTPAEATALFVQRERVFEPDPARHRIYREQLEKYRRLFPLLHPFLSAL
jgi:xylulokinase